MTQVQKKTKQLQSCVSILLLVILAVIAAVILIRQSHFNLEQFGIITDSSDPADSAQKDTQQPAILENISISDYQPVSGTSVYDADTLYEKINGKAPLYVEAGFVSLSTRRFANLKDENLMFEIYIYDMNNPYNAFSVYSGQKRADAQKVDFLDINLGYKTKNSIYFVCDKFYIETAGFQQSDELFAAVHSAAQNIFEQINSKSHVSTINELELFQTENLVPGSIKLYQANTFGFAGLKNVFTAFYEIDGQEYRIFLSLKDSRENAKSVASSYKDFLIENGGKLIPAIQTSLEGNVIDFYDSIEIVIPVNQFVLGIHEASDQKSAEDFLLSFINNLQIRTGDN